MFGRKKAPVKKYTLETFRDADTLNVTWSYRTAEQGENGEIIHYHTVAQHFNFKAQKLTTIVNDTAYDTVAAAGEPAARVQTDVKMQDFSRITDKEGMKELAEARRRHDEIKDQLKSPSGFAYKITGEGRLFADTLPFFKKENEDVWTHQNITEYGMSDGKKRASGYSTFAEYFNFKTAQVTTVSADAPYVVWGEGEGAMPVVRADVKTRSFADIMASEAPGDSDKKALIAGVMMGIYKKDVSAAEFMLPRLFSR